jgi:hypothetical protein
MWSPATYQPVLSGFGVVHKTPPFEKDVTPNADTCIASVEARYTVWEVVAPRRWWGAVWERPIS